jgi:5-methylcytosine-specific restriction protein A
MATRVRRPCTQCGQPVVSGGKCARHLALHHKRVDQIRGNSSQRGYDNEHRTRFRAEVLRRDNYTCQICSGYADRADHHPLSRKELVEARLDPNDPVHGRALCEYCHNRHTAKTQGKDNWRKSR